MKATEPRRRSMTIPMCPGANLRALISFTGHHSITPKGFTVHCHAPELYSPRTDEPIQFNMDIIGHGTLVRLIRSPPINCIFRDIYFCSCIRVGRTRVRTSVKLATCNVEERTDKYNTHKVTDIRPNSLYTYYRAVNNLIFSNSMGL